MSSPVRKLRSRPSCWLILIMLLVLSFMPFTSGQIKPSIAFYFSTAIALLAALGLWLGFGKSAWRFPIIFVAAMFAVYCLNSDGPNNWESFLAMTVLAGLIFGIVAVPIVIVRIVRRGELTIPPRDWVNTEEALQFGIVHLFGLTTFVALFIGIGRVLAPMMQNSNQPWLLIIQFGIAFGICSLVCIWATLGRASFLRISVSSIALAAVCCFNFSLGDGGGDMGWLYVGLTFGVFAWITTLMLLLRWEGYRFVVITRVAAADSIERSVTEPDPIESAIDPLA